MNIIAPANPNGQLFTQYYGKQTLRFSQVAGPLASPVSTDLMPTFDFQVAIIKSFTVVIECLITPTTAGSTLFEGATDPTLVLDIFAQYQIGTMVAGDVRSITIPLHIMMAFGQTVRIQRSTNSIGGSFSTETIAFVEVYNILT